MPDPGFLFIGGCARSGTSALWRVVTADPHVSLGLERYGSLARDPGRFTPELFTRERFLDLREGDAFYDSFDFFPPNMNYRGVVDRFDSARWRGDKIPRLYPLYDQIERAFPDARVVFIVRNPFDVAASYQHRALNADDLTWPGTRDHRTACAEWNASLRATISQLGRLSIHVLDYESFFGGQADLVGLATFLELDPDNLQAGYEREIRRRRKPRPDVLEGHGRQYISRSADFAAYRELLEIADGNRLAGWPAARRTAQGPWNYGEEKRKAFDYARFEAVPGHWFRGPAPSASNDGSIAFIGSASTFGRFSERPYPALTAAKLGTAPLNLGRVEASAPFYYTDPRLISLINDTRCAVIECFSARGTGTRWHEARDHGSALLRPRGSSEAFRFADRFFADLLRTWSEQDLDRLRAEIREAYVAEMRQLLELIEVPKVLLCLSARPLGEGGGLADVGAYMGGHPHFVTDSVVRALAGHVDQIVEVAASATGAEGSSRDDQQRAADEQSRAAGPRRRYFHPSPALHRATAEALVEPLGRLLRPARRVTAA